MKRACELTVILGRGSQKCVDQKYIIARECSVWSLRRVCPRCVENAGERARTGRDEPRQTAVAAQLTSEDDDVLELSLGARAIKPSLDPKEDVYLGPRFKTTILPVIW